MPPGEAAMALVLVQQHFNAVGLQMRHRRIEILPLHEEGVVQQDFPALVGRNMIIGAGLRQHKILLAAAHENGALVLPPISGAHDILVETPRTLQVRHAEREMQDATRLHPPRLDRLDARHPFQRRTFESAHRFSSSGTIAMSFELRSVSEVFTLRTFGAEVSSATK